MTTFPSVTSGRPTGSLSAHAADVQKAFLAIAELPGKAAGFRSDKLLRHRCGQGRPVPLYLKQQLKAGHREWKRIGTGSALTIPS